MANQGRRWFEQRKDFVGRVRPVEPGAVNETPELLTRCPSCSEAVYNEALEDNQEICPLCGHHFKIDAFRRLALLALRHVYNRVDVTLFPEVKKVERGLPPKVETWSHSSSTMH